MWVWLQGVCGMHPHLRLHQSRLSNSPVVEQLINTADEAVEIKENREDKGHTGDLRMRNKKKKRQNSWKTVPRHEEANEPCSDCYIMYTLKIIWLGMTADVPADIQIGINVAWV